MKRDRCVSFLPVSKLNCAGNGAERSAKSEKRMWSGVWPVQFRSQASFSPAAVCDFSSAGTVSLAYVAGAEKLQSDAEIAVSYWGKWNGHWCILTGQLY